MSKPTLFIRDLTIHKMLGFPNGIGAITDLAKNINIIAGPNASGKSSTARMIQNVIWKENIERIRVEAKLEFDNKDWDIHIDNGYYSSQSNGFDKALPSIPAVEESKRYFLALHELIKEDDQNFAAAILQEAIGGYNLQEAQKSLGYSSNTPNRRINEYRNYETKRKIVEEIEYKQAQLQNEERKLADLVEELEEAKEAAVLQHGYTYLIEFLETQSKKELLNEQKKLFPEQMPLLIGNEYEEIIKFEKSIDERNQEIARINREKNAQKNELAELQIPSDGFDKVLLDTLQEKIKTLEDLERNLNTDREALVKNEKETKIRLHRLFSDLKKEKLDAINLEDIHELDEFFEKAARLLYEKQATELKIEKLEKEKIEQPHNLEDVHHGIRLLIQWFEKETSPVDVSKSTMWVLFFLGLLSFVLFYFLDWIGAIGLLVMFIYVLYLQFKKQPTDSLKDLRVSDFKKTGLQEPAVWQEEAVSKRLEELYQELQNSKQQQRIYQRLDELNESLTKLQIEFQKLENERQAWLDKLSNIPELDLNNIERYSSLYWFLKDLHIWQKHTIELEANRLSYEEKKKIHSEVLAEINFLFSKVHVREASDASTAKAILKNMQEKQNFRSNYLGRIANLKEQKLVYHGLLEKDEEKLKEIYSRLNLEIGAKDELRSLLNKKEEFQNLEKDLEQTKRSLIEKENQLKGHSLFESIKEKLSTFQIDEAKERKEKYTNLAEQVGSLDREITRIKTLVNKEQSGHELEIALANRESALDDLEAHYQSTRTSITGDLIINGLRKQTQENSDLKVLNRAKELFTKITHGHFELLLDDSEGGNFKARDTKLNQGLELEQLSSGTRIQLLIAVRLAFIESQETGVKLPIIADEVLANSDDLRAKQIIEALVEISKDGRQVFYFTAQSDEVKKWQEYLLHHPEIKSKTVILDGQVDMQMDFSLKEQIEAPSVITAEVLSPEKLTREAYHEQLNPPVYNLLSDKPEKLHLSYLIENNEVLYACLKRGIQSYGHLESFIKNQGKLEGLTDEMRKSIYDKIALLKSYQNLYQKGRAKPIDRAVLLDSGSVSNTFIDAVDAKLKELENNPKKLIVALREREVSGFLRSKIDELEEYLTDQHYLSNEVELSSDEINLQLHAIISRLEIRVTEADQFLSRLIDFTYS